MKNYSDIDELIANFESEIESLADKIAALKAEPSCLNEKIILKYIETASTGKTKDFIRTLGIKSERGSLYSSSDVSKLIKSGADDISPELLIIARMVVNMKKNKNSYR